MTRRFALVAVSLLLLAATLTAANPKLMQIRVFLDSKTDYLKVQSLHPDIVFRGKDYFDVVADQAGYEKINQAGLRYEITIEDVVAFNQSRLDVTKDMGGYKTLDEINAYIDNIVNEHRNTVAPKLNIGTTIEGRTMWAIKISDNPTTDEDEPEILFHAAIHAREVITPEVCLALMDTLTNYYGIDPHITELVNTREIWFVVPVNPDGYYHNQVLEPNGGGMWRKNRRDNGDGTYGVDLNRNYSYQWGYDDVGSSPYTGDATYRGTGPFSEPEAQNMRDFIASRQFVITMDYHSYSNLILWPWGYDYILCPDNDLYVQLGDTLQTLTGGYAPSPITGLYLVNGSTVDWGYGEQIIKNKNFALTIEVGNSSDGFWPPLSRVQPLIQENLPGALYLIEVAGYIYQIGPPEPPVLFVADSVDSIGYEVSWTHDDTLNPALMYELVEMQGSQRVSDSANDLSNWTSNQFTVSSVRQHSLPSSFYSGSGDNFQRYLQTTDPFEVYSGDSVKLWMWYDIETDWDYAYVEVSTDGSTFTPIAGSVTTESDPNGNNRGHGITGSSGGWIEAGFDLSAYLGQLVFIRISYYTDSYVANEWIYVDDIYPVPGFAVQTVIASDLIDTSYSFADKPVGTYFYKVRAQDAESQWSGFSNIAETYVGSDYICFDSDGDGFGDPGHPDNMCPDDNCPATYNPSQTDTDSDGAGDLCDICPNDPDNDIDNDSVCGDVDNCPTIANADQADTDGDNIGDACCCTVRGNVVHSGGESVDIADLIYLVDFMFNEETGFGCPMEADIDANGTGPDIADLVYFVDYMFNSGPAPPSCP